MNLRQNISLKQFNTFGLDVKADMLAEVSTEEELKSILSEYKDMPKLILGGGSNLLLTKDFKGLVIKISIPGIKIFEESEESVIIEAGAGVPWHDLVMFAVDHGYGGIENLSLIPGTAGAAPMQNIGAYGQEVKDTFYSLTGLYTETMEWGNFNNWQCRFGYRESIFKHELKDTFIITSVKFKLSKHPVLNLSYGNIKEELEKAGIMNPAVKDVSNVIIRVRKSKLPDPAETGNAGSFFKNPVIDKELYATLMESYPLIPAYKQNGDHYKIPAAWLIEQCGWKGKRLGNIGVHDRQPLVLVNYGGGKGEEILNLARKIKKSVKEKFNITLSEEVNIV